MHGVESKKHMSLIVKGYQIKWESPVDYKTVEADVKLDVSRSTGVWLVDGGITGDSFCMIVGAHTEEDAARAYAKHRKAHGQALPRVFRVFPLIGLEPITLTGVVDVDGDEEWSAFQDAWIEVRL